MSRALNYMAGDPQTNYNYRFYTISLCPTREPISAKAEITCTQRQENSNGDVFSSFAEKNMPRKKNRVGA